MAISLFILDYCLSLAPLFLGRQDRSVLEFGEAQTYELDLAEHLDRNAATVGRDSRDLRAELEACRAGPAADIPFAEARLVYRWTLGCGDYQAADLGSTNPDFRIDLNDPFDLGRSFDIVINNGTTEHVFDQANVYRMIHRHTAVDGFMVHYTPGLGWIDHGLYHVQPTFFLDLARSNGYDIISYALVGERDRIDLQDSQLSPGELARSAGLTNALLCACLRRTSAAVFSVPIQGSYADSIATADKRRFG